MYNKYGYLRIHITTLVTIPMHDQYTQKLKFLESEAIFLIRETIQMSKNPVMFYSMGKDSAVLLHIAQKAVYPQPLPFPLLHIDTGYKFTEMYEYRKWVTESNRITLIVHKHECCTGNQINPFIHGIEPCCKKLKTDNLLNALRKYKFDFAIGGSRRDEEKSRAKEKYFSLRNENGQWDFENQQQEMWSIYNSFVPKSYTFRVFPLSDWTECDIWHYIEQEKIAVVPLYFANKREVITINNKLYAFSPYHKDFFNVQKKYEIQSIMCRFRSLGCVQCTGAIQSEALTIADIIKELPMLHCSERSERLIDSTHMHALELKKKEGYF